MDEDGARGKDWLRARPHGIVSVNYAVIVYCMLTIYVLCIHGPNGLLYSLI